MKLKSLILGSVAAAGLSTAGYAADLGVLTSLDVCDSLGISGLTISSSDNCLSITGGVDYEFQWGDYAGVIGGDADPVLAGDQTNDWESVLEVWLNFVGTASTDFGPAAAHIGIGTGEVSSVVVDEVGGGALLDDINLNHAYVSIGDTTVINVGVVEDALYDEFDFGAEDYGFADFIVGSDAFGNISLDRAEVGGASIQVISTVGEGVTVAGGIENLDGAAAEAGTIAGYVNYSGAGISAFVYADAGGVLDGLVEAWEVTGGFTANFDNFNLGGQALFVGNDGGDTGWSILGVAGATFDMFTISLDAAASDSDIDTPSASFGGSIGAAVTDTVSINLAGNWFDGDTDTDDTEEYVLAVQLVADLSESLTLTTEVGYEGFTSPLVDDNFYADAELGWEPGGQFESFVGARFEQTGAYSVRVGASKEFQ